MANEPKWGHGKLVNGVLTDITMRMYPRDGSDVPLDSEPLIATSGRYGYDAATKSATVLPALPRCSAQTITQAGINLMATGVRDIGACGTGVFRPDKVVVKIDGGTVTGAATLSIGVNSPNYDDIMPATSLGLTATGQYQAFSLAGVRVAVPANTVIKANVTAQATGSGATCRIDVGGTCE